MIEMLRKWQAAPAQGWRFVGFGSSNTEVACHNMGRHSWFCWLSRTVRENVGKQVTMINSGVCGDTTRELLARFDRDVRPLAPSAVVVTIGGNDQVRIGPEEFGENLARIVGLIRGLAAEPLLQTYYCPLLAKPELATFDLFMDEVCAVAARQGVPLIDNLVTFHRWHDADLAAYERLFYDPMHLNGLGNAAFAALSCRALDLPDPDWPAPERAAIEAAVVRLRAE